MLNTLDKPGRTAAFGDFQTPRGLADQVCNLLKRLGVNPAAIVEPTCGVGNLLFAAMHAFPEAKRVMGLDINPAHIRRANDQIDESMPAGRITLRCEDFFATDWPALISKLPDPILIVGNPPWVTNSRLGSLGSGNLPEKSNFQNHAGLDALTGKSNFDISEWMLIRLLKWLQGRSATLAMLCKTSAARKTLLHLWETGVPLDTSSLHLIDAAEHFDVAVDACLLICRIGSESTASDCAVFSSLSDECPTRRFGYRDQHLVADLEAYEKWKHLTGREHFRWRSGIKHDCSGVMEFHLVGDTLFNGLEEKVAIENDYVYPMLKSADVANGNTRETDRFMLVTQQSVGQETASIENIAPLTWDYLNKHSARLERRASAVYKNRPGFSIFGVGPYAFSAWKVAISGFYKSLKFRVVGPIGGKPTVLDDTTNFIACDSEQHAQCVFDLLNSSAAQEFFNAFVFWDAKRPVTIELLRRLDILRLAESFGKSDELSKYVRVTGKAPRKQHRPTIESSPNLFSAVPTKR